MLKNIRQQLNNRFQFVFFCCLHSDRPFIRLIRITEVHKRLEQLEPLVASSVEEMTRFILLVRECLERPPIVRACSQFIRLYEV